MMAADPLPKRREVHRPGPRVGRWVIPAIEVAVVLVLLAAFTYVITSATHQGSPSSTVRYVTLTPSPTTLAGNALKLKPLSDLAANDRVVYEHKICLWQSGDLTTAIIKCAGHKAQSVQTAQLAPVELRDPSGVNTTTR